MLSYVKATYYLIISLLLKFLQLCYIKVQYYIINYSVYMLTYLLLELCIHLDDNLFNRFIIILIQNKIYIVLIINLL